MVGAEMEVAAVVAVALAVAAVMTRAEEVAVVVRVLMVALRQVVTMVAGTVGTAEEGPVPLIPTQAAGQGQQQGGHQPVVAVVVGVGIGVEIGLR
jgi:hypothetical protein